MNDNGLVRKLFTILYRYARMTLSTYLYFPDQIGGCGAAKLVFGRPFPCSFTIWQIGQDRPLFKLVYAPLPGMNVNLLAQAAWGVVGTMRERGFVGYAEVFVLDEKHPV